MTLQWTEKSKEPVVDNRSFALRKWWPRKDQSQADTTRQMRTQLIQDRLSRLRHMGLQA